MNDLLIDLESALAFFVGDESRELVDFEVHVRNNLTNLIYNINLYLEGKK